MVHLKYCSLSSIFRANILGLSCKFTSHRFEISLFDAVYNQNIFYSVVCFFRDLIFRQSQQCICMSVSLYWDLVSLLCVNKKWSRQLFCNMSHNESTGDIVFTEKKCEKYLSMTLV